jgi:ATP:ADP antiporter, AAA family
MGSQESIFHRTLRRWVNVEPSEIAAVGWSFLYFFALLCGYYILRPLRDEMGIAGGVENLDWLFTGTFLATVTLIPVFGWAASRFERRRLLPGVYFFFISNILLFYGLFESDLTHAWVARAFFIWVSVFNMFVVSVFWSFMTDLFSSTQSKRLFGFIAAGGTIGALLGPAITAILVGPLGTSNLLLISGSFLLLAVFCIKRLGALSFRAQEGGSPTDTDAASQLAKESAGIGGGIFAGIKLIIQSPYLLGICAVILLYTTLATFLYFQQAEIIRDAFSEPSERTAMFALMDFSVNALTVLAQIFVTARIVKRFGMAWSLAFIPIGLAVGFLILGFAPVLGVIVAIQITRRAGNFAVMKPSREMLYVVLGREEKYKAKNIIDTVVYRGGDAVSAWAYSGLQALGLSLAGIALVAVPVSGIWAWISFQLGRKNESMREEEQ